MEKKINKKKIVKFAAANILKVSLGVGIGVCICDSCIDHTLQLCPLSYLPFGKFYQAEAMVSDLNDKGFDDAIYAFGNDQEFDAEGHISGNNDLEVTSIEAYWNFDPTRGYDSYECNLSNYKDSVSLKIKK